METLVGFVAGYLAGCKDGPDGLARLRSSAQAILKSAELKRLTGEAIGLAGALAGQAMSNRKLAGTVTDLLAHRAAALGKGSRAA